MPTNVVLGQSGTVIRRKLHALLAYLTMSNLPTKFLSVDSSGCSYLFTRSFNVECILDLIIANGSPLTIYTSKNSNLISIGPSTGVGQ